MINLTDISMINGCLTLLGFLGVLMVAIRNLVLLPAPLQTVAQKPCRPMPRRSIRGQTCGFDDSPNAIKGEIFPQNCQRRSIKRKTHDPDGSC